MVDSNRYMVSIHYDRFVLVSPHTILINQELTIPQVLDTVMDIYFYQTNDAFMEQNISHKIADLTGYQIHPTNTNIHHGPFHKNDRKRLVVQFGRMMTQFTEQLIAREGVIDLTYIQPGGNGDYVFIGKNKQLVFQHIVEVYNGERITEISL